MCLPRCCLNASRNRDPGPAAPSSFGPVSEQRETKIHGRYVPVKAEVQVLDAFSAHADADELLAWATSGPAPATTYVVHGEPESAETLAERLETEHGWTAVVPRDGERVLV